MRYLDYRVSSLEYANEAVLPFYILHQSVLICVGYFILEWGLPDALEWLVILAISLSTIMVLYEYLVRRINVLRFLFGMKVQQRPKAIPTSEGQVLAR